MKVKQPVYERRSRSGFGRRVPVGPTFPDRSIPRSHFTYEQTSSECPERSAAAMYAWLFPRIADCSALISGRTGSAPNERMSSVRFPGTKVYTTGSPVSGACSSRR
jgi:hypothetical protein